MHHAPPPSPLVPAVTTKKDSLLGVDVLSEKKMDKWLGPTKSDRAKDAEAGEGEVKAEDFEAPPAWEREPSVIEDGDGSIDLTGYFARDADAHSVASTVQIPPTFFGDSSRRSLNAGDLGASFSGMHGRDGVVDTAPGGVGVGGADSGSFPAPPSRGASTGRSMIFGASSRAVMGVGSRGVTARLQRQGNAAGSARSVGRRTVVPAWSGGSGPSCGSPGVVPEFGGGGRGTFVTAASFSISSSGARARPGFSDPDRADLRGGDDGMTGGVVALSPSQPLASRGPDSSRDGRTEGGVADAPGVAAGGGTGSALTVGWGGASVTPWGGEV